MSITKEEAVAQVVVDILGDTDHTIRVLVAALAAHEELHNHSLGRDAKLNFANDILTRAIHNSEQAHQEGA
jgi:hypothetical protein